MGGTGSVQNAPRAPSRSRARARIGGAAALASVALLIAGAAGLSIPPPGLGLRNWLVVLFQINAGASSVSLRTLTDLNPWDITLLVLVGVSFVGLWPGPGAAHRIWLSLAVALPFAGIVVLLATAQSGRSALMGAGIVVAALMLTQPPWRMLGMLGLVANGALLGADFATGNRALPLGAGLIAAAYLLLALWFTLLGMRMLRTPRTVQAGAAETHR